MASSVSGSNFLDDVLNQETDESVVSALVGSLESQLSSSASDTLLLDANNHANIISSVNANQVGAFRPAIASTGAVAAASSAGPQLTTVVTAPTLPASLPTNGNTQLITGATPASAIHHQQSPQTNTSIHSLLPNGNPNSTVSFIFKKTNNNLVTVQLII